MNPLKKLVRECIRPLKRIYYRKEDTRTSLKISWAPTYNEDGLITHHKTTFMQDPLFQKAYERGCTAVGQDYTFHWRVHVALWAASQALKLEGDFVECGVNKGFLSSAVMEHLNWNQLQRQFYLFDTFQGLDPKFLTQKEMEQNIMEKSRAYYRECYEEVKNNFSEFKNVHLIRGSIPSTLEHCEIDKVAYLSIDMNCVTPEIAAAEYFWPKLAVGAPIILDDYNYGPDTLQQEAFDQFAKEKGTQVLSLPTGQGLIIKL